MTLTPAPAVEERIQDLLDTGEFKSVDEVLAAALDRLVVDRIVQSVGLAEFQRKIDEGWEAAERGDTVSGEEFEAEMDVWRAKINARIWDFDASQARPWRDSWIPCGECRSAHRSRHGSTCSICISDSSRVSGVGPTAS